MTLQTAFNNFILDKRLMALADDSIKSYENIISIFLCYVGNDIEIADLTRDMVDNYILSLFKRNLSRSTVATYVRNARIFLCWVYMEYDLSFNPHKIKVPKSPKKNVHMLSDTEIEYIFNSIKTAIPWMTARNKAIVALMLDSGIRQSEVCSLQKKDFDFERMVFKVCGKGAKERIVPLGGISRLFLDEYLKMCPYKETVYVFVDRMGNILSKNAVRLFVYKLKETTGVDLSSHKFRHNFATNYCIDNLKSVGKSNVYDLSILMGHESIETTKRYEHFAHEMVAAESSFSHLDMVFSEKNISTISLFSDIKKTAETL